jgi:hypothetical protein
VFAGGLTLFKIERTIMLKTKPALRAIEPRAANLSVGSVLGTVNAIRNGMSAPEIQEPLVDMRDFAAAINRGFPASLFIRFTGETTFMKIYDEVSKLEVSPARLKGGWVFPIAVVFHLVRLACARR